MFNVSVNNEFNEMIQNVTAQIKDDSYVFINKDVLLKIFITILMCLISSTAIIGNILVIIAMKIDKNLRTVSYLGFKCF